MNIEKIFSPRDNSLFIKTERDIGAPLTSELLGHRVTHAALRFCKVPVTPKEYRRMIDTYMLGQPDISPAEREGLAIAMGHSEETQRSTYDKRSINKKIAGGVALNSRFLNQPT